MLFTDSFLAGGTERQFSSVVTQLDRKKYDLHVGCIQRRGPFLAEVEALGIPIQHYPIPSLRSPGTLCWMSRLVDYLRCERIDAVHAFDFYTGAFAVPAARWAGVPVIIVSRREVAALRPPLQRWVIRLYCQMATAIVANSRAASVSLTGFFGARSGKVTIVPNGIDLADFPPRQPDEAVRQQLELPADAPLVGILAALRPEKDHATFLRAAALVHAVLPEARFLVIGGGPERVRLESLVAELGLKDSVLFLGDRRDVADLLAALEVVVLSSLTESSPNAVLEAMAAARPVVATRVGGVPDLVEDGATGFLVPPGAPAAMSQRILDLLRSSELRHAFGTAGRARVEREFTTQQVKQRLEALYDRLLGARLALEKSLVDPARA